MAGFAELTGRVAIVTGGAGALGRGVGPALLDAGATVVVTDKVHAGMDETVAAAAEAQRRSSIHADIGTEEGAAAVVRQTLEMHGRLDILVNIVGGYAGGPSVAETDLATWRGQFELNATTAFLMARAAVPVMQERGWGRIVNVSSRVARTAPAGLGAYAVSKAAVITLTEVLANETRAHGITVNAVLPSVIDTPANRRDMPNADFARWVKPEAIGGVIRFLVSEESGIISGAAIPVYGRA